MPGSIRDRVTLNNGTGIPLLGLGVFGLDDGSEVRGTVLHAFELGYRSIDTASIYKNERGVGRAIRESGVPREEIFLTTKVWNDDQRNERTLAAFEDSLERLQAEYVDLYLVHWPVEGRYKQTWRDMERIYRSGRAKAIGVSNFNERHLEDLLSDSEIVPTVNQVEFHPRLVQPSLLDYCRRHDIQVEAWSPLMHGQPVKEPAVIEVAEKYSRTPAQIVLRWDLQHGVVTIPKSGNPERLAENARIFDFELSREDMSRLDALDEGKRVGADPDAFDF
jgi:diketogulonate reductase-like aldo/keto reductase